jgi:hypothetical protein
MAEHPHTPTPLTLTDDDLIAVGAYIRRADGWTDEQKARALAAVGMKLTKFFMDVARVAVDHYDRETAEGGSA